MSFSTSNNQVRFNTRHFMGWVETAQCVFFPSSVNDEEITKALEGQDVLSRSGRSVAFVSTGRSGIVFDGLRDGKGNPLKSSNKFTFFFATDNGTEHINLSMSTDDTTKSGANMAVFNATWIVSRVRFLLTKGKLVADSSVVRGSKKGKYQLIPKIEIAEGIEIDIESALTELLAKQLVSNFDTFGKLAKAANRLISDLEMLCKSPLITSGVVDDNGVAVDKDDVLEEAFEMDPFNKQKFYETQPTLMNGFFVVNDSSDWLSMQRPQPIAVSFGDEISHEVREALKASPSKGTLWSVGNERVEAFEAAQEKQAQAAQEDGIHAIDPDDYADEDEVLF